MKIFEMMSSRTVVRVFMALFVMQGLHDIDVHGSAGAFEVARFDELITSGIQPRDLAIGGLGLKGRFHIAQPVLGLG